MEKVPLSDYPNIKPACLPAKVAVHSNKGLVSGWGTSNSDGHSNAWLHGAEVNVFKNKNCGNLRNQMTPDVMCAGTILY